MASRIQQDSPVLEARLVNDGRFVDVKLKEKKTQLVTKASRRHKDATTFKYHEQHPKSIAIASES